MGLTKTFCKCRGVSISQSSPIEREQHELELKKNAMKFLSQTMNQEDKFSQKDVGENYLGSVLAVYLNTLQLECSGATGNADELRRLNTMAAVISEMWRVAAEVTSKSMEREDEFHLLLDGQTAVESFELIEFYQLISDDNSSKKRNSSLAEILTSCFSKSMKEYEKSIVRNDLPSIKHYAAALGDILNEMIDIYRAAYLANYPPMRATQSGVHGNQVDPS